MKRKQYPGELTIYSFRNAVILFFSTEEKMEPNISLILAWSCEWMSFFSLIYKSKHYWLTLKYLISVNHSLKFLEDILILFDLFHFLNKKRVKFDHSTKEQIDAHAFKYFTTAPLGRWVNVKLDDLLIHSYWQF